jgi:chemotaxis protein MotB
LADTEPRVANTSAENRARNRRVEIIIDLSGPMQEQEVRLRELIQSESDDEESILGVESDTSPAGEISW